VKYLLLLLLALGSLALALHIADSRLATAAQQLGEPRIPNYSWAEMSEIFTKEEELKDEQRRIQLYHRNQSAILVRLREEEVSLRNAATTLDAQARENHPHMHEALGDRYPGLDSVERMALRLLQHLEEGGCRAEVIERFCCEMTTWSKADASLFRQPLQPRSR
jgi:hypothetical protein